MAFLRRHLVAAAPMKAAHCRRSRKTLILQRGVVCAVNCSFDLDGGGYLGDSAILSVDSMVYCPMDLDSRLAFSRPSFLRLGSSYSSLSMTAIS